MADGASVKMRSWLFAPGDSEKKMAKAAATAADIVVIDLEDSVAIESKNAARAATRAFLDAHEQDSARFWVRINPLDSEFALTDLAAIVAAQPGGIMLPKAGGRRDVERLDHYLSALETAADIAPGATRIIAIVTETAAAMYHTGDYAGLPRLAAMSWGAEDLSAELGAADNKQADGSFTFTYQMARSFCLLGAKTAGVVPIETVDTDYRNIEGLKARAQQVRQDGYRGMLAIHPAQVDVINAAFTPSADEIAAAQEIVDIFAANPGAGTIGHNGQMLDRPHLINAQSILAMAHEK